MKKLYAISLMLIAACADSNVSPVSAELEGMGVAKLEVVERQRDLTVLALDAGGSEIARVDLTVGRFVMLEDDRGEVDGRQLTVNVLGRKGRHESEGYTELSLPTPREPSIAAFLLDPTVHSALQRWGVGIESASQDGYDVTSAEGAYDGPCGTNPLILTTFHYSASGSGNRSCDHSGCSSTCAEFTAGSDDGEFRCCPGTDVAAERRCNPNCTSGCSNYTTSCGNVGSAGCAVCWTWQLDGNNYCAVGPIGNYSYVAHCTSYQ